jgi:hypothetical protein
MFQFRRCPPLDLYIQSRVLSLTGERVAPFGDRRLNAWLQLPDAFRSCPRPSSALDAKASTACLSSFFLACPPSPETGSLPLQHPSHHHHTPTRCSAKHKGHDSRTDEGLSCSAYQTSRLAHRISHTDSGEGSGGPDALPSRYVEDSSWCLFSC